MLMTYLRRSALLVACLLMITVSCRRPANAQATLSPAPASTGATFVCPLLVLGVAPVDAPQGSPAREYAFALQAFDGPAGSVSGTLWILADNRSYKVSFEKAIAVGRTADSLKEMSPIVVRFPEPVSVNAAYVASVRGPNAGECEVAGAWIQPAVQVDVLRTLKAKAPKVAAVAAGDPGPFVKPGCDSRASPVATTRLAQTSIPDIANLRQEGGDVYVEVVVDKNGSVATAWVWATPYDDLAGAALGSAKATRYAPARIDCEAITGIYMFVAAFRV
jgi:hypothetical protein